MKEEQPTSQNVPGYSHFFETSDQGFCVIEMLFDSEDKPVDYRFLEANPAFTRQSGLRDAVGKRMLALEPNHETHWFEIYGHIAKTGEPRRFTHEAKNLEREFDVYGFRVGRPEERKVAVLFHDISGKGQTEESRKKDEVVFLNQDVSTLERLHRLTERLATTDDLFAAMEEVLNTTLDLLSADLGNLLLYDPAQQKLKMVAQRGFLQSFLRSFGKFSIDDNTALGRTVRNGSRVVIEDIETEPDYGPYRVYAFEAGYRSVQTTPIFDKNGKLCGVISTFFREPHQLSSRDGQLLDIIAHQAANFLEQVKAEDVLEERVEKQMAQVRYLASELISAEHKVIQHVSQTLHDDLQQLLYAADIQLNFIRDKNGQNDPDLDRLSAFINQAMRMTRQLTLELSPPILKGEGLYESLAWLAGFMRETHGLVIHMNEFKNPHPISEEKRLLLFQIVRKLLYNMVKHTGIKEAWMTMSYDEELSGLRIVIRALNQKHDGRAETEGAPDIYGLNQMNEQIRLYGGWANINNKGQLGKLITLFLPSEKTAEIP